MVITLNFEAPGRSTAELTALLHELFASPVTRTRTQQSSYQGPDGPVHARTVISKITTPLNSEAVNEAVFALACKLDQDCIALSVPEFGVKTLLGPRADKWLPFNPDHFVEY